MKNSTAIVDHHDTIVDSISDTKEINHKPLQIDVLIFENEVPPFVESELTNLYASPHSSLKKFRALKRLDGVSTYIVKEAGKIAVVLLFSLKNGRVQVLNEVINIRAEEIERFSKSIFFRVKSARVISFKAIETDLCTLSFPFQRYNYLEDLVITLPDSSEKYLASLGNATRRNIRYYRNKIGRNFPSFNYRFYDECEVTENHVRAVLNMRSARFADKKKTDVVTDADVEMILKILKECGGMVGLVTIDGNTCAGQISYRTAENHFGAFIAHEPKYNEYWLGVITCYLTICECIARGAKEFHFQWGRQEYKYRLLGVQRDLDNLQIYRSRWNLVTDVNIASGALYSAYIRRIKLWLLDPKNREKLIPQVVMKLQHFYRNVK